jgi:hypothetical protein
VLSSDAPLAILVRPVVTLHPVSQSVVAGGSITLSASAEGHPLPMTFRWRKDGSYISNLVVNGTDSFLTLTNVQAAPATNQFYINVAVTNRGGVSVLSSNAVITVLADTDGDGMPDEWELFYNFDPADPADAAQDRDNDGVSNEEEYRAGTDPVDMETILDIALVTVEGSPAVAFVARSAKTYTVLRRDSVDHGAWISVADVPATAQQRAVIVRDPTPLTPGQGQGFYRLVTPRRVP